MKPSHTIFATSLVAVTISINVAYADLYDDAANSARNLTNKAGNILKDATGDWCSGKKYFSEMNFSERLKAGSESLTDEIGKLTDASSKMEYDIKFHIEKGLDEVMNGNQALIDMNNKLCLDAKTNNYANVNYNGSNITGKGEVQAQIKINLATIRSSNDVLKFYNDQKSEFNTLNNRIKDKANELAVLKKNFDNLLDPRSENKTSSYFESVIGNACTTIGESENLIMEYNNKNSSELFRDVSQKHQTNTISEGEITSFMESCNGADNSNQKSLMDKAKSLFGF